MSRIDAVEPAASAGSKALATTLAGAGTLSLGGMTDSQIAMAGGLVIAAVGMLLQAYFGWRRDRREEREHRAKMRTLPKVDDGSGPVPLA